MTIDSLDTVLAHDLKDIYDAEKRLTKALPKMAKKASSEELRAAIEEHLEVTKNQVSRLEEIFQHLEMKAQAKPCAGMKGLIEEGEEVIGSDAEDQFKDIGIITAARKVEHYEIAAYRSLYSLAECLGNDQVKELLQQTLEEEEQADTQLSELYEQLIEDAQNMDVDEEEDEEDMDMEAEEEEAAPARRR